ncbi:MAG: AAA family ATPase [Actinomycetaceae bacterium]|nr:AAA family ATPase [Actinomycetaceae bacterium]
MERDFEAHLLAWRKSKHRKPMLLSGVRQCGKTYLLKKFGEEHYRQTVYVNFERQQEFHDLFERTLDPRRIIEQIALVSRDINADEPDTLYIFDEIQAAPKAVTALKYFAEETPHLHVIGAGSLLGVSLPKDAASFPVGKVDIATLHPMSFSEYVRASGYQRLLDEIIGESREETEEKLASLVAPARSRLQELFHQFLLVGGMPEAVKRWIETEDMAQVDYVHQQLLQAYRADFAKHAPATEIPKLNAIWESIPAQLAKDNQKFVFGHAMKGKRAADLANALQWLSDAGLVVMVPNVENPTIPLKASADPSKFKLYLADMGLLRAMAQLPPVKLEEITGYSTNFYGAIAENYVLGELQKAGIDAYYWTSSGIAEVDFVVQVGAKIVPIEVKAAANPNAKSLARYRDKYRPKLAFKISLKPYGKAGELVSMPHYCIPAFKTLVAGGA